jgi:hypothetical protein
MRRTAQLLAGIAILSGCRGGQIPTESAAHFSSQATSSASFGADVNKELATLRQVTAPFQQFERATAAGWSAPITPCMSSSDGGMGFHYGNLALINGTVSVDKPELLLYEPEKNGRLRLVAVEYIIPYGFHSRESAPPVLFGQQFKQNDTFHLWGLHAWVWKENPSGMFASWNPTVTCANATDATAMTH